MKGRDGLLLLVQLEGAGEGAHGGDVNLLEVTPEKVARLQLVGACGGCPMSVMTLRFRIERLLEDRIPELAGIEAVMADYFDWSQYE